MKWSSAYSGKCLETITSHDSYSHLTSTFFPFKMKSSTLRTLGVEAKLKMKNALVAFTGHDGKHKLKWRQSSSLGKKKSST